MISVEFIVSVIISTFIIQKLREEYRGVIARKDQEIKRLLAENADLREQSHSEAPWRNARNNLPSEANSNAVITLESMGEYYGSLIYGQEDEGTTGKEE